MTAPDIFLSYNREDAARRGSLPMRSPRRA